MPLKRLRSLLATMLDVAWLALQLVLGAGIAPQANLSREMTFCAIAAACALWQRGTTLLGRSGSHHGAET